jgi:hypothetical protein
MQVRTRPQRCEVTVSVIRSNRPLLIYRNTVTSKKKPKVGRPPRSQKPATERIEIRVTTAERKAWERAAGSDTLSDWLRTLANATAGIK